MMFQPVLAVGDAPRASLTWNIERAIVLIHYTVMEMASSPLKGALLIRWAKSVQFA